MAKVPFPVTIFTDSGGNPLSLGSVQIRLNTDAQANGAIQVSAQPSSLTLDSGGNLPSGSTFWPNASLNPTGTTYLVSSFAESGQPMSHDVPVTVT